MQLLFNSWHFYFLLTVCAQMFARPGKRYSTLPTNMRFFFDWNDAMLWWTSDYACYEARKKTQRRRCSSSCDSFIDHSWGSSSKTDGEPFLSSSSGSLAHSFDYIISGDESWSVNHCHAVGKPASLAFCELFRVLLAWVRTHVGHFGIRCFLLIHSWPRGAVRLVFIKPVSPKTLWSHSPFEYIGRLLHANVNS